MCEIATSIDESMKILGREYAQNEQSYVQFAKAKRWRNVPHEPEEIVQRVFGRVAANIAAGDYCLVEPCSSSRLKIPGETKLEVFIRGKIMFLWQELYQREFVRRKPMASLAAGDLNIESSEPSPSKAAENAEISLALQDCMSRLSENKRMLIALKFFEELKHAEIGAILGITGNRVARLASTAISQLRECLDSKQSR